MTKKIDPHKTIFALTEEFPELIPILKELGFLGVANPVVRQTLGRKTTLAQGCDKQGKSLEEVQQHLAEKGFLVQ